MHTTIEVGSELYQMSPITANFKGNIIEQLNVIIEFFNDVLPAYLNYTPIMLMPSIGVSA